MTAHWRAVGIALGVAGALVAGTAIGVVTTGRRAKRRRTDVGDLKADRESTVVADDGVALAVAEIDSDGGDAELTVIFVHGFVLDRRMWHHQHVDLPAMTDPRVRVVLYDQRSHGRSGRGTREHSTIDQLGHDLASVIETTAPTGPIVLVGHSMGAMTIMALAEQRPELFGRRIDGVALLCTSAGGLASMRLAKPLLSRRSPVAALSMLVVSTRPELVEWGRRLGADAGRPLIRAIGFGAHRPAPELIDLMDRMIARTKVEVMTEFLPTFGTHDRLRALAHLRACEVLIAGGDADHVTPWSHTEALARELPDAELVRLRGAGHMAPLEQPELINAHLADLFRRSVARKDET